MCTDVDRNDKARVCEPGSVRVLGRRQIEMYSRLIHTVDHVEGYLRAGFDALDAFLCHTWAVTVTGAPKAWAARFIEKHERSARAWYRGGVEISARRSPFGLILAALECLRRPLCGHNNASTNEHRLFSGTSRSVP